MSWITDKIKKSWTRTFPIFYEEIIRKWLVKTYKLKDYEVIQPRIYYFNQEKIKNYKELNLINTAIEDHYNKHVESGKEVHQKILQGENKRELYFCADGYYKDKNGKKILMEAKSWIPPHTVDGRLVNNPHALYFCFADKATIEGQSLEIDKYILVYWSAEADGSGKSKGKGKEFHEKGKKIHKNLIRQWKQIKPEKELIIIYIIDILEELINKPPEWYKEIIIEVEDEMQEMFNWLLGKSI